MELFEKITWMDHPLAYIIRRELTPAATTFLTPSDFTQQIGFVVYPAGGEIKPHLHRSEVDILLLVDGSHGFECWKTPSLSKLSKVLIPTSTRKSGSKILYG
jgi:hypothetical protein